MTVMLSAEVEEALRTGFPVVACETTLVAHGFPERKGLDVALAAEARIRAAGAVPATVGVMDGAVRAGLGPADFERFATAGEQARKAGARDIAACAVQRVLGATTVGGTLAVCRAAGIRFLTTGGTGGVHRGFSQSLDISSDLLELARTQAMVVSSGAKSILDVAATAEMLETLSVPVLGWRTTTLPLFYTADGGPPVSATVTTAGEAAAIAAFHWQLNGSAGLLLARPPDLSTDLEPIIADAVSRVRQQGLSGQSVTPAVLRIVHEMSEGRSVQVNSKLIEDNAALAAEIAVAYAGSQGGALAAGV